MTETEAKKIIASMMALYSNYRPIDVDYTARAWADTLEEYSYEQADMGLRAFARSDTSGFAPSPGQVIDKIQTLTRPEELNEMEAWALVSKALRNSGYNSVEEFSKLPPLIQKAVGIPDQLRTWALEEDFNEDVNSSNFIKNYRVVLRRQKELDKMPEKLRNLIRETNKNSLPARIEQKRLDSAAVIAQKSIPGKAEEIEVIGMDELSEKVRKAKEKLGQAGGI